MMFQFLIEFVKHPKAVGAIMPSGRALAEKMMEPIQFERARCIVEYGPGTGSFTRKLVKYKKEGTKLFLIENNPVFYKKLRKEFGMLKGVYIIHGSAENVNRYLLEYGVRGVDYIVSGLPFTSLPKDVSEKILLAAQSVIGANGKFITFQYSLVKRRFFEKYFTLAGCLLELKNLPPAYVLVMKQKGNKEDKI